MTTERDIQYMQRALELADQAQAMGEIPVGAVVVYQDSIIGEGFNQSITLNDPSAHAEMIAIRQAAKNINNYRLIDCELFVTLEPCPMCAGLLVHSRIKRLVYGAADLKTGAVHSHFNLVQNPQLNHKIAVKSELLAQQCSSILSNFFKQRRAQIKAEKQAKKKANLLG